jgi:hypothetical protein
MKATISTVVTAKRQKLWGDNSSNEYGGADCYGRLAVVSDVDDGGFALNVDKRVERICRAITKQVQRSDARIEVDVMHTGNECTGQAQRMY